MGMDHQKWFLVQEIGTVRGILIGVYENSDSIQAAMLDTCEGVTPICQIDKADPGARARAVSLAEAVFDALEVADMTWEEAAESQR